MHLHMSTFKPLGGTFYELPPPARAEGAMSVANQELTKKMIS